MTHSAEPHQTSAVRNLPLFVDLDGTLTHTDVAQELLLRSMKSPAVALAALSGYRRHGVSGLKAELADKADFRADLLPYNADVVAYIRQARDDGRQVILATAADQKVADAVADYLGLFDAVLASHPEFNLKGERKLAAIREYVSGADFEYLGDSKADIPIWQAASARGFARIPGAAVSLAADATLRPAALQTPKTKALLRAMRPHQWAKNVLIFLPLIFAHLYADAASVGAAALAFAIFSLCASAVYLLNDMLDVDADREHPTKCKRPFAAGLLSPLFGVQAGLALFAVAIGLAFFALGPVFGFVLLCYVAATKAYSLWLKRYSTVDVVVLALLYTVRILAGAAAIGVMPSPWLLTFSLFFFLSLAYMKRYIELARLVERAAQAGERLPSRNYYAGDLTVVQTFGIANGALAVLTLAEYVSNDDVRARYLMPDLLWLLLPVMMFWTYRSWMWANRDQIGDDPVAFALKDRISRVSALIMICIVLAARHLELGGLLP